MPRSLLPQDYTVNGGVLFEDFENFGEWTPIGSGGTLEANLNQHRTGTQSLKLNVTTTGSWIMARKIFPSATDFRSASSRMHFWFYCHTDPSVTLQEVLVQFTSTSDLSKSFNLSLCSSDLHTGWNHLVVPRDRWLNVNNESWAAIIRMYFKLVAKSGQTVSISVDELRHSTEQLPRCVISFDDGHLSAYTEGYSYMNSRGVRGTMYIIPAMVGSENYMTLEHLDIMNAAGWALANHSYNHPGAPLYLTGLSQSQIENEIQQCTAWLINHGYLRAAYHVAYPGGAWNSDVFAALNATGMLTGRTTWAILQYIPVDDFKLLKSKSLDIGTTLAAAKDWLDKAITQQSTVFFHGHVLTSTAGLNAWAIADFQALIDYIVARNISCLTIDEWYEGLTNPRYRSSAL
ncbi:MAG: polysaccharide deacetylase family protein [bacterium]